MRILHAVGIKLFAYFNPLPSKHMTLKRRHLDVVMSSRRRDNVQMTSL